MRAVNRVGAMVASLAALSFPGDLAAAQAKRVSNKAILASAEARSVSFTAKNTQPVTPPPAIPGERPLTAEFRVFARKPNLLRIETIRGDVQRIVTGRTATSIQYDVRAHGTMGELLVSDGANLFEYSPILKKVREGKSESALSQIRGSGNLCFYMFTDVIFDEALKDFKQSGRARVSGKQCRRYVATLSDEFGAEQIEVYFEERTRLPVRVVLYDCPRGELRNEVRRTDYSSWVINPKIDDRGFRFSPPK